MKRYLLLASVAGCLLGAGNAMATIGSIAEDGQSALLGARVNIITACNITEIEDFDYKDIVLIPGKSSQTILSMDSGGTITEYDGQDAVAIFDSDGTAGSFKVVCPDGMDVNWSTTGTGGSGAVSFEEFSLARNGDTQWTDSGTITGSGTVHMAADLYMGYSSSDITPGVHSGTPVQVTLSY